MNDVQRNDRQLTASAVLVSRELPRRVLLIHHRKFDMWMQPGGHVERDERPYEGAIRETREETGIDISALLQAGQKVDEHAFILPQPRWVMEQKIEPHGGQPLHYHLDHLYVLEVPQQDVQHAQAESHGIGWFTWQECQALTMYENTRFILREVLGVTA